jgi:hypothetical protein
MEHDSIGPKDASMAWAMESLIACKVRDRAAEVRADGARHGKALLAIAEHKDLFFSHKGRRAVREVRGVADLE